MWTAKGAKVSAKWPFWAGQVRLSWSTSTVVAPSAGSSAETVSVEAFTPPQPPVPTVTSGPKADPFGEPAVTCLLKRHDGWNYLLAVNASPEPVSAELSADGATTVEVLYENRTCTAQNGRLADTFTPFAVHIYRWR